MARVSVKPQPPHTAMMEETSWATQLTLEVGLQDDDHKDDGGQGEAQPVSENLSKVPTIRCHRGKDAIDRQGHEGSIVEEGND